MTRGFQFLSRLPDLTSLTGALDRSDRCRVELDFLEDFGSSGVLVSRDSCCSSLALFRFDLLEFLALGREASP